MERIRGGFLPADKGPGALIDVDVEGKAAAEDIGAEQAVLAGLVDGDLQPADGQGIFGAGIDVALVGVDGPGGDDHALEHGVGVGFEDAAVHESARIAFVGVAQHVFDRTRTGLGKGPLEPGGKAGPPRGPAGRMS